MQALQCVSLTTRARNRPLRVILVGISRAILGPKFSDKISIKSSQLMFLTLRLRLGLRSRWCMRQIVRVAPQEVVDFGAGFRGAKIMTDSAESVGAVRLS